MSPTEPATDPGPPPRPYVIEVLDGLVPFVRHELDGIDGVTVTSQADTEIQVTAPDPRPLRRLRTAVAVYESLVVPVRRPRGLLSPDHLQRIGGSIAEIRRMEKKGAYRAVRLSAAGSDSEDMQRFLSTVASTAGLAVDDDGELFLRLRRADHGWELLIRLTPRPLSTRTWRTEHHTAGLNACVAAAMVQASAPDPDDRVIDLTCGSGTILIERRAVGRPALTVGVDIDASALAMVEVHQRTSRQKGRLPLVRADVADAPFAAGSFTRLFTNMPWGENSGDHADNDTLYPDLLATARRLAAPTATLVALTHDVRRWDVAVERSAWREVDRHRVFQKGHRPVLSVLRPD